MPKEMKGIVVSVIVGALKTVGSFRNLQCDIVKCLEQQLGGAWVCFISSRCFRDHYSGIYVTNAYNDKEPTLRVNYNGFFSIFISKIA